jgi:hypothetical protein
MSGIPLHIQRDFERRWASPFTPPAASNSPKNAGTKAAPFAAEAGLAFNPGFTIRKYRATVASDSPTYLAFRERNYEGMRMAGLPEG